MQNLSTPKLPTKQRTAHRAHLGLEMQHQQAEDRQRNGRRFEKSERVWEMGEMSKYTHVKKPYFARCIQNTGENEAEVLEFMEGYGYVKWHPNRDGALYLAHKDNGRDKIGIPLEHWVRVGENKEIKIFPDPEFKLKYQKIAGRE